MVSTLESAQELTQVVAAGHDGSLRALFQNAGFSQIEIVRNLSHAQELIEMGRCDLLIMEERVDGLSPVKMITDIRQNKVGRNPFLPIVALLSGQDRDTATKFILAGVDDVWAKPISPNILISRMTRMLDNDVEYEVAEDYLGPKRPIRGDVDADSVVAVPNVVRLIAEGVDDITSYINEGINQTTKVYQETVVAARGSEISKLIVSLTNASDPDLEIKLGILEQAVKEFTDSVEGVVHDDFRRLARLLVDNTQAVRDNPDDKSLQLLKLLAQALELSYTAQDGLDAQAWEIINMVEAQTAAHAATA